MLARIERASLDRSARTTNALFWAFGFFFAFFIGLAAPAAHADSVVKTIDLGASPRSVAITPDGQYAWVAFQGVETETADVYATATNTSFTPYSKVRSVNVGSQNSSAVAVNPNGQQAYVFSNESGTSTLTTIATATNAIYAPYTVLGRTGVASNIDYVPSAGMAVTRDGYIYAATYNSNTSGRVDALTTGSGTPVSMGSSMTVGIDPRGVAATPDGRFVFVANYGSNTVSKIATASLLNDPGIRNTVVGTATVGTNPWGIAIADTPNGQFAYVVNYGSNNVSVIDTDTLAVVTTISNTGIHSTDVAVTPDGRYAYVAICNSVCRQHGTAVQSSMSVIATASNTVVNTMALTGSNPMSVAISPDGRYAYVANLGDDAGFFGVEENSTISVIALDTLPAITTATSLPDGLTGSAYRNGSGDAVEITITGTPQSSLTAPNNDLPPGLSILTVPVGATLHYYIIGTPTVGGTYTFTLRATNSPHGDVNGGVAEKTFTIKIAGASGAPAITTTSPLPDATLNKPYADAGNGTVTIAATGYPAPKFYWVGGSMPPGLSIDEDTGAITGTPTGTVTYTYQFDVRAENAGGQDTETFEITVVAPGTPPMIVTTALPDATVGEDYRRCTMFSWLTGACTSDAAVAIAANGTAPLTYALASGALPTGLTLNPANGQITGTPGPGTAGTYNLTVRVSNASGFDVQAYTLTVNSTGVASAPAFPLVVQRLPTATETVVYEAAAGRSVTISVRGIPTPVCQLAAASAALPTGLTLNPDCTITGTPDAGTAGSYPFRVEATNAAGTAAASFTLTVAPAAAPGIAAAITTASLPNGTLNTPYVDANGDPVVVQATGTAPIVFTQPSGTLPPGLSVKPDGTIAGTPTKAGPYKFTIAATNTVNGAPVTVTKDYTINVIDPNAPPLPTGGATAVPALDGAALALLALLLAGGAAAMGMRRR